MTEDVITKLEDGFLMGFSDREACLFANISPMTLYRFCEANPDFSERKEELKDNLKMIAKKNIARGLKGANLLLSQWYAERKMKDEFTPKSEVENSGKVVHIVEVKDYSKAVVDGEQPDGTLKSANPNSTPMQYKVLEALDLPDTVDTSVLAKHQEAGAIVELTDEEAAALAGKVEALPTQPTPEAPTGTEPATEGAPEGAETSTPPVEGA